MNAGVRADRMPETPKTIPTLIPTFPSPTRSLAMAKDAGNVIAAAAPITSARNNCTTKLSVRKRRKALPAQSALKTKTQRPPTPSAIHIQQPNKIRTTSRHTSGQSNHFRNRVAGGGCPPPALTPPGVPARHRAVSYGTRPTFPSCWQVLAL